MWTKLILLVSALLVMAGVSWAGAEPNLVAWWQLDDGGGNTASDSSGQGHSGTIGGVANWTTGAVGGALGLDGSANYIDVDDADIIAIGESLTIAMWLKVDTLGSDFASLLSDNGWDPPAGQVHYNLKSNGQIQLSINGPPEWEVDATDELSTGQWHHVATTYDANDGKMVVYVNGVRSNEENNVNRSDAYIGPMVMGAWDQTGAGVYVRYFDGLMDDIRIYNKTLNEAEIAHVSNPAIAWDPSPSSGTENVCPNVVLSWSAGDYAAQHEVYLGTDYTDVNDATTSSSAYRGTQSQNSYDAGANESLQLESTYYWRIDEVNEPYVWKGKVWQFTTNDGRAYNPNPAHEAIMVDLAAILSWSPGCGANSHDVYFGTDFNDVTSATASSHPNVEYSNETVAQYDPPGDLDLFTDYYWRVDEVADSNTLKGEVWSFRSRGAISDANLIVWYKFDETSPNSTAYDSSGHEMHGDIDGPDNGWDPDHAADEGGSRIFDDDTAVIVPNSALDYIEKAITICVWANGKIGQEPGKDMTIFDTSDTSVTGFTRITALVPSGDNEVLWRAGNDTNDVLIWEQAEPATWQGDWHHLTFVKDEVTDRLEIYFDGFVVDSNATVNDTLAFVGGTPVKIGAYNENNSDYEGNLDDFRMYDRALSAGEIARIFRRGDLGSAWAPEPYNGQTDIQQDVILKWRPGDWAASHDVYFGRAWDDVNDATTSWSQYKGSRNLDANTYDPCGLDLATTYYWRIDEVNGPNTWKGRVWRFRVADFLIVDDMESYNAIPGSGNEIYDTWDDGFINGTGCQVALEYGSVRIHEDVQSMRFAYNNAIASYKYSEADANTTGPRPGNLKVGKNWTEAEVKALTLFFYGEAGNDTTEQMYVAVEDSSKTPAIAEYGDLGEDMNDVAVADWHQWDIPLSAFGDNGVTLTDVNKVRIGFGDRVTPVVGGSGIVYFDDIRLYLPKCVPWLIKPAADLSDNCIVDFDDVVILAGDWLRTDRQFDTVQQPDYAKRVGWWKLDNDPYDYSGNFFDGTVEGDYAWVAGQIGTGAIELKGNGSRVLVPHHAKLSPQDEVSVCAWVKYSTTHSYSARVVVKGADTGDRESYALQVTDDDEASFIVRDVNTTMYGTDSSSELYRSEWSHIAGTYDGNVVKCYVNAELSNWETAGLISILVDTNDLAIGNRADATNRAFIGTIDDVQLYEYALSEAEIVHVATEGGGYMPLTAASNLYNEEPESERAVNFLDYAVIADSWLEEILWP